MKKRTKTILRALGALYLGTSFVIAYSNSDMYDKKRAEVKERPQLAQLYQEQKDLGSKYLEYQAFLDAINGVHDRERLVLSLDCIVERRNEAQTQIPKLKSELVATKHEIDSLERADPELNKLNSEITDKEISALFPPYYLIKGFLR